MQQTWRWFGPQDPVSIDDMLQSGVEGVVTALHHIPPGQVWTAEDIAKRQAMIATRADGSPSGIAWDVVESLPVSEDIKTQSGDVKAHLAAYKTSLQALAAAGIETICYNFMPVLDWTRTNLAAPMPHGGHAMLFDLAEFAAFDIHVLARPGAAEDYDPALIDQAARIFHDGGDAGAKALERNIIAGLPGANDSWSLDQVRALLERYRDIDAARLRQHLVDFLAEVAPVAQDLGLRLCAHPDDPPFDILGLPRILSRQSDYEAMTGAVDLPANGVTFCTGSLGVNPDFDPAAFVSSLGPRIHFAHLRNTSRLAPASGIRSSFFEDAHLAGDTDMVATLQALLDEEADRRTLSRADHSIPFRPDHGQAILSDLATQSTPGYPLVGRMRGLAELRGLIAGLQHRGSGQTP